MRLAALVPVATRPYNITELLLPPPPPPPPPSLLLSPVTVAVAAAVALSCHLVAPSSRRSLTTPLVRAALPGSPVPIAADSSLPRVNQRRSQTGSRHGDPSHTDRPWPHHRPFSTCIRPPSVSRCYFTPPSAACSQLFFALFVPDLLPNRPPPSARAPVS
ncbi:hypothetical protein MBLNU459_g0745t1 [Dothideomycetes sp. NU459]